MLCFLWQCFFRLSMLANSFEQSFSKHLKMTFRIHQWFGTTVHWQSPELSTFWRVLQPKCTCRRLPEKCWLHYDSETDLVELNIDKITGKHLRKKHLVLFFFLFVGVLLVPDKMWCSAVTFATAFMMANKGSLEVVNTLFTKKWLLLIYIVIRKMLVYPM